MPPTRPSIRIRRRGPRSGDERCVPAPRERFGLALARTLAMEHGLASMLTALEDRSREPRTRAILHDDARRSHHHITSLENAFQLLGRDVEDVQLPAMRRVIDDLLSAVDAADGCAREALVLEQAERAGRRRVAAYETLVSDADRDLLPHLADLLRHDLARARHTLATIGTARSDLALRWGATRRDAT